MTDESPTIPPDAKPFTRALPGPTYATAPMIGMPRSDDAERGVLSCFFQNPSPLLADAAETISADYFYHFANRQIYDEMQAFQHSGRALDLVTFSVHLMDKGLMDKIGGPAFLAELLSFVPTPAHYGYYKGILKDKWLLRRIVSTCSEGVQQAYEHQEDIDGLLDKLEASVLAIRPPDSRMRSDSFTEAVSETFDAIQVQMSRKTELAGLSTGFPWLDEMTGGLCQGFYVIAARPSLGKTTLSLNIFDNIALDQLGPVPCGFFSLEMSRDRLIRRIIARQGWIPLSALSKGQLDADQQRKFNKVYGDLMRTIGSRIDNNRPALTINQVRSKARMWKKQYGIGAIFLDYLQRMGTNSRAFNKVDAHAENSTGLADLSKELNIPIVVLAQLNRDCEKDKRRPRMSDVEGCGRIEQDGDVVALLSLAKKQPESAFQKHVLFDIAKNRDGPTGSEVHLFSGAFQKFDPDPVNPDLVK